MSSLADGGYASIDLTTASGPAGTRSRKSEASTATLHILPLHAKRDPDVHEWEMVRQRLGQLASLPPGWNGGKGIAPDRQTITFVGQQLVELQQQGVPPPSVSPSPDGAIYAEWHSRGLDIELIFEQPYHVSVLAEDARGEVPPLESEGIDVAVAYGVLRILCDR